VLGENDRFAAIMSRSGGQGGRRPQLMWYVDPIRLIKSAAQRDTGTQVALAMFPALGLDGLRAVGGTVILDADPFDWLLRVHLLLAYPRDGVLELLAFRSGPIEPEPWVPADVSAYTTLYLDLPTIFRVSRTLVDGFRGEGTFDLFVQRRIEESTGVELEQDLLPLLTGRVTLVNSIERPVTPRSRATLLGLELRDVEAAAKVLEKIVGKNEAFFIRRSVGRTRYVCFEPPRLAEEERGEQQRPSFGILGESFVLADRESLFRAAATTLQGGAKAFATSADFRQVATEVFQKSSSPAMIQFRRPAQSLRMAYERILAGDEARGQLRRRAERNPLLRNLNAALQANPLPPYAVIQRYLTPGGAILIDDRTGLHYMVFALKQDVAARNDQP